MSTEVDFNKPSNPTNAYIVVYHDVIDDHRYVNIDWFRARFPNKYRCQSINMFLKHWDRKTPVLYNKMLIEDHDAFEKFLRGEKDTGNDNLAFTLMMSKHINYGELSHSGDYESYWSDEID